jgi:membrane associated rhomboid family serine protease/tetratricopeptide (TPR) repeat protein
MSGFMNGPGDQPQGDLPPRRSIGSDLLGEFPIRLPERTFAVSWILGINLAVMAALALRGVSLLDPSLEDVLRNGGNHGPYVAQGEWWRLLTSAFVHVGLFHLAFNLFAMHSLRVVEGIYGSGAFLLIYFCSAIGASILSILWRPDAVSAGASGAVFGMAGALIAFFQAHKDTIPESLFRPVMRNMLFLLGLNVLFGLLVPGIDNAAHFGGLACGYVAARLCDRDPEDSPQLTPRRAQRILPLIGALFVAAALIPWRASGAEDIQHALAQDAALRALRRGQWDECIQSATQSLEKDGSNGLLFAIRAEAHLQKREFQAALADLDRALAIDSRLADARKARMFLRWRMNRTPEALADAQALVEQGDRDGSSRQVRGELLLALGEHAKAEEAFRELARGVQEERSQAELFLWIACGLQGRRAPATERIREWVQGPRSIQGSPLEGMLAALYAGEVPESELLDAFDRRDTERVELTRLFWFLGARRWVMGDREGARQYFARVIERGTSEESTYLLARDGLTKL